jgi:hypothetical protein
LQYILYIDSDCLADTGAPKKGYGVEYRLRYRHEKGQADLYRWEKATGEAVSAEEAGAEEPGADIETTGSWTKIGTIEEVSAPVEGQIVTVRVPYDLLDLGQQFCWLVEARSSTKAFATNPPKDWMPDEKDLRLTQYEALSPGTQASAGQ